MKRDSASIDGDESGHPWETDVIIVGAGPSGLTAAMEIAASGVKVTILEKRGEPALSRAGVIQPRVMEIFAMRGLADTVLRRAEEVNGEKHKNHRGIWAGLPGINYGLLDSDYPYIVVLSQIEIEAILAQRCHDLGVTVQRNAEVLGVEQDGDGVTVHYRQAGIDRSARALYVIGADGGRSAVRESLGVAFTGHDAVNLAVNVDAEISFPFTFDGSTKVVNSVNGWGLCYPLSENVTRFALIDPLTMLGVGRSAVIDTESAFASLRRVFGSDFGTPPARISQFHDAMFRAETIRIGRVLLVGESVRVHYPASGVGMNFCIQDATNLGWKVAAAVQGWGPADILDSYETERGPQIDGHLDSVRAQTAVQFSFSEDSVALKEILRERVIPVPGVQKALAEMLSGISADYGDGSTLVGSRVPNASIADGRNLYEVIAASSYTLVSAGDPGEGFQNSDHLVTVIADLPGVDSAHLLIRPDGYVDAVGDASAMAERLAELRLA